MVTPDQYYLIYMSEVVDHDETLFYFALLESLDRHTEIVNIRLFREETDEEGGSYYFEETTTIPMNRYWLLSKIVNGDQVKFTEDEALEHMKTLFNSRYPVINIPVQSHGGHGLLVQSYRNLELILTEFDDDYCTTFEVYELEKDDSVSVPLFQNRLSFEEFEPFIDSL